jgi:hypothetical protein
MYLQNMAACRGRYWIRYYLYCRPAHYGMMVYSFVLFFPLALQPTFGPWPTCMKLSVLLQFTRSWTFGRDSLDGWSARRKASTCSQTQKNAHTQTLNIHALSGIRAHDPGFRASEDSTRLRPPGYRDRLPLSHTHIYTYVYVCVILSKNMYMYMCPIPNGFRDRAVSLYNSKIVDKKEILRTVSNTGIYCSNEKLVQFA